MSDSNAPDRAPGTVWVLRRDDFYPMVYTEPGDRIVIDGLTAGIVLSRKDARLLAKRINECLDATVRR